ncbi:MAG: hypothetical protein CMN77_12765 [Spirochaetaceae bacterium]|nr:hypothetical protein [Spirochaetaceae bacterium]|tara:strand:- start:1436 stop:1819 length:384 start_codon:yes stop_codon:yes gene_type:complete
MALSFPWISQVVRSQSVHFSVDRMKISIIYEPDCPNYGQARSLVEEVCSSEGVDYSIEMIDSTIESSSDFRKYGSPTVFVEGRELEPSGDSGNCCRVYTGDRGQLQGVLSRAAILEAIRRESSGTAP